MLIHVLSLAHEMPVTCPWSIVTVGETKLEAHGDNSTLITWYLMTWDFWQLFSCDFHLHPQTFWTPNGSVRNTHTHNSSFEFVCLAIIQCYNGTLQTGNKSDDSRGSVDLRFRGKLPTFSDWVLRNKSVEIFIGVPPLQGVHRGFHRRGLLWN